MPEFTFSRGEWPLVTLLIAMRNEERFIERCLRSVLMQDYPANKIEVFVLDGESSDGSRAIAERLLQRREHARVMTNSEITQAAGWNMGIALASGAIVGIVSAHSELAADYVRNAVETLHRTGADLVGGPMRAVSEDYVGRAIAAATSSRFGVGGARFHYAHKETDVDTVYMGLCTPETYARVGGFDTEMVRNQDDEFSYRLLDHGGRIVCNPAIRSEYFNRPTIRSLWTQYFQYGFWKVRVAQKHRRQIRFRHFAPSGFVGVVLASAIAGPLAHVGATPLLVTLLPYMAVSLGASCWISARRGWSMMPVLPVVFATLHVAYGTGFITGSLRALTLHSKTEASRAS